MGIGFDGNGGLVMSYELWVILSSSFIINKLYKKGSKYWGGIFEPFFILNKKIIQHFDKVLALLKWFWHNNFISFNGNTANGNKSKKVSFERFEHVNKPLHQGIVPRFFRYGFGIR